MKLLAALTLAAGSILARLSTAAAEPYPQSTVNEFVRVCADGIPRAICVCMIDRLQESMAYEDFVAIDLGLKLKQQVDPKQLRAMSDAVASCHRKNDPAPSKDPGKI